MGVVCRDKDKEGETGQCGSVMWRMDWVLVGIQLLTSPLHLSLGESHQSS
jgi:hypothetical protein